MEPQPGPSPKRPVSVAKTVHCWAESANGTVDKQPEGKQGLRNAKSRQTRGARGAGGVTDYGRSALGPTILLPHGNQGQAQEPQRGQDKGGRLRHGLGLQ